MVALSSSASGSGCPVSVRTCHNFTLSNFRTASDCQGLRKGPATRSKGSGMELSKLRPVFVRLLNRCPAQTRPNRRVEAQALDLHRPRPPTRGARVHAVAPAGPAPATGQRRKGAAVAWAPPARLQEPSQVKVALLLERGYSTAKPSNGQSLSVIGKHESIDTIYNIHTMQVLLYIFQLEKALPQFKLTHPALFHQTFYQSIPSYNKSKT